MLYLYVWLDHVVSLKKTKKKNTGHMKQDVNGTLVNFN